jgi:trimethylamine--corrinoid protein Co-methyltransferase
MSVQYSLAGGLDTTHCERIHRTALRVLDDVGVEVHVPALLDRITGHPGVRVDGTRVRFTPELVDGFVQAFRASHTAATPTSPDCTLEILTGYGIYLVDPATDRLRPMSTQDCIDTARLVGALYPEGVRGGTPGQPQDVPPALRQILAFKIGCEHTKTNGWVGYTTLAEADIIRRMAEVSGQTFGLSVFPLDPLILDGPTLRMALDFLDRGTAVDINLTNMALRGMTAPIHLPAAFVGGLATVLGAFTAFNLLGTEVPFSISVFPFDLRAGNIVYGTPEHVLINLWSAQLNAWYGSGWGYFQALHTNAVLPDAHALLERGVFAASSALAGGRCFGYGGCGGIDVTFSPELLLYDVELLRYLEHLLAPVEFTDETLGFDILKAVGPGGEFLSHDSTLDHCRELWSSSILANQPADAWLRGEAVTTKDAAREKMQRLVKDYAHEIDPSIQRELDALYHVACEQIR